MGKAPSVHSPEIWRYCFLFRLIHPRVAIALDSEARTLLAELPRNHVADDRTEMIYRYLTGPRFRQRIEAVVERFTEMQADLDRGAGYDVGPGELGENITTAGLGLEKLPRDTELRIGASARILLAGLRTPCVLIDRFQSGLKGRLMGDEPGSLFKAGFMAIVTESGQIAARDPIRAILPAPPHCQLPPLRPEAIDPASGSWIA
jgi:hypothetical protein